MNACGQDTISYVEGLNRQSDIDLVVRSEVNLYKCPMMRKLLWDKPIETEWVIWFDDDTHILSDIWWAGLWRHLSQHAAEAVGELRWWSWKPNHWEFVKESQWFRGVAPQRRRRYGRPGISFMTGAYWVIKTVCLRELDWPDLRLVQKRIRHEDKYLSEALRQQGWKLLNYARDIKTNDAPTRTVWILPPGSNLEELRVPEERKTLGHPEAKSSRSNIAKTLSLGERAATEGFASDGSNDMQSQHRGQSDTQTLGSGFVQLRDAHATAKQLRREIRGLKRQLEATISVLRSVILEGRVHEQASSKQLQRDLAGSESWKRRILVEWLKDPKLRAGLGLRVHRSPSPGAASMPSLRKVDCDNRREYCQAVCCRLSFSLTEEEIRGGQIQWSLEQPFVRLASPDGYCIHLDRETYKCSIYEKRPVVCRRYVCMRDRRVWEDFETKKISPSLASLSSAEAARTSEMEPEEKDRQDEE
jgi:Fe-S-cluster containining protein